MQELLLTVARGLVEDKDAVTVTVDPPREDGTVVYHLSVAEGDMGASSASRAALPRPFAWSCAPPPCGSMKRSLSRSTEPLFGLRPSAVLAGRLFCE